MVDSLSTGVDLIEIERIRSTIDRFGQRFLDRIYTSREQQYCRGRVERLAGRFAVKEAVSKVLGIGIRRIRWRDIEVLPNWEGKPEVYLHGRASTVAKERRITDISVSITHSRVLAAAIAVGIQHPPNEPMKARDSTAETDSVSARTCLGSEMPPKLTRTVESERRTAS